MKSTQNRGSRGTDNLPQHRWVADAFWGRTPQPLLHVVGVRLFRARPLLLGRGARSPWPLGHDGGATHLRWHLGRDDRAACPCWLLGQADSMACLRWLPGRTLPSVEQEGSRCLQGETDTYQRILVLQVVPLDIIDYLVIISIIIITIAVSVLPLFPCLQLPLLLPLLVLLRLPQPLTLGMIRCPHGRIPRQQSRVIHEDEVPWLVLPLSKLVS